MKIFGIILNILLLACQIYLKPETEFLVGSIVAFCSSLYIYIKICNTPTKNSEKYETYRNILPTEKKYTILKIITLAAMLYTHTTIFLTIEFFKDFYLYSWWEQILIYTVVFGPYMFLWKETKGTTLKNAKKHFEEVVNKLHSPKYVKLCKTTLEPLTPDTPLWDGIINNAEDMWGFICFIDDIIKEYKIPFSVAGRNEWRAFIKRVNNGEMKTEKRTEVFLLGQEAIIQFIKRYKTLGGVAIYITEEIESKEYEELTQQLNDV